MMDQMLNQLKLQCWVETGEVLAFQALEIPYLSNLNQIGIIGMIIMVDFLQKSIMVIHVWISNNTLEPYLRQSLLVCVQDVANGFFHSHQEPKH